MSTIITNQFKDAFKDAAATPTQRLVAYMLADAHNDRTQRCDPSVGRLMDLTGLSKSAVIAAIRALERAGHITVQRQDGRRSRYLLHPRPANPCASSTGEPDAPARQRHRTGQPGAPAPVHASDRTGAPGAPETEQTEWETELKPQAGATPASPVPASAPTPTPPALSAPTIHLPPGLATTVPNRCAFAPPPPIPAWPTLDQVLAQAQLIMAAPLCAEKFWCEKEANGWLDRHGLPLRDWRAAFRAYALQWRDYAQGPPAAPPAAFKPVKAASASAPATGRNTCDRLPTHPIPPPTPPSAPRSHAPYRHPAARSDTCNLPGRYARRG
jgi:hypothetical protein